MLGQDPKVFTEPADPRQAAGAARVWGTPAAGVRGRCRQPAGHLYFQSGKSAEAYAAFSAPGPPSRWRLPGRRPVPALPLVSGGRWAGPRGGLASLPAARAGRAPPEGALFSRTAARDSAGEGSWLRETAQVSLRHARLRRAGSGWGHAGALGSARVRGCSFVRGRRPSRRRGGRGVWSLSSPSWARRTLGAAALLFLLRGKKKSPARFGYSILWTQKCEARVLFCLAVFVFSPVFSVF